MPEGSSPRSNRFHDLLCERVAEMVLEDPGWIDRAREIVESDRYRSAYEDAWRHILEAGQLAVVAVLTSRSPAADPLKTDTPFALLGMVSEEERLELLKQAEGRPGRVSGPGKSGPEVTRRREVAAHLQVAAAADDFTAVDHLYQALLKASRDWSGGDEGARLLAMVGAFSEDDVGRVLSLEGVDRLLDLDPPLESVLAEPDEELRTDRIAGAVSSVRGYRTAQPRLALRNLALVLKRVRDKRYHGFKTTSGARDAEILAAAREVLRELAVTALRELGS